MTGFIKKFVVLTYLFIFVGFFRRQIATQKISMVFIILFENKNMRMKSAVLNGFNNFPSQFFFNLPILPVFYSLCSC